MGPCLLSESFRPSDFGFLSRFGFRFSDYFSLKLPLSHPGSQGGDRANACGDVMPHFVKMIPNAVAHLRQVLIPKTKMPLFRLENLFASLDTAKKWSPDCRTK